LSPSVQVKINLSARTPYISNHIIQALHNIEPPGRHVTLAVTGALKAMTTTNC